MSAQKVLIIDDDKLSRKFMSRAIGDDYEVILACDGQQGIEAAAANQPDVILLDVEMPGKNGFDVCTELRKTQQNSTTPIIFISGRDSLQERMKGFDVGGDDYVVKPCEQEIIRAKVGNMINRCAKQDQLSKEVLLAHRTAQDAMASNAEIGKAIRFVSSTYSIATYEQLAANVLGIITEFDLACSLMFVTAQGYQFYSHNSDEIAPIEAELLTMMHERGRFCDFAGRTICNYPRAALLIKNMPLDDPERYGRIKDTVPFILCAVDAKVVALDTQQAILSQAENLARSTDAIRSTIQTISMAANDTQSQVSQTVKQLIDDLDETLPGMGLEDDQEKFIIGRIDKSFTHVLNVLEEGQDLTTALDGVVRLLAHLMQQQNIIIDNAKQAIEDQNGKPEPGSESEYTSDVELF